MAARDVGRPPGGRGAVSGDRRVYQGYTKLSTTAQIETQDLALSGLAERINAAHDQALHSARTWIERAVECGRLLLEAKANIGHGGWIPWVQANLNFGERQAQKYMRIAERAPDLPDTNSNSYLTIDGALKFLSAGSNDHSRTSCFTGCNERYTPAEYLELARQVLGEIDLDPASSDVAQARVQAKRYFTHENDGLSQSWQGRVWLNPPYSHPDIVLFTEKLVAEVEIGNVDQAILLTNNYTDTAWFHHAESAAQALCFPRGRIRFESADDETLASPVNGQAFFYYGRSVERFRQVFGEIGFVR